VKIDAAVRSAIQFLDPPKLTVHITEGLTA